MILINKTAYRTGELRKLLSLVHEHMALKEGRMPGWGRAWGYKRHTVTLEVKYSRGGYVSGCATLNGFDGTLRLHRPKSKGEPNSHGTGRGDDHGGACTYRDFIWLAYHEMMHLYGYGHRQFIDVTDDEMKEILTPTGHTLYERLPFNLKEGKVQIKISGTTFAAVDLNGIAVESQKEVKRGKGLVVVIEATPDSAKEILSRLQAKDVADSGLSYEARYACRMDAKRLDKQLSQAAEAATAGESASAPAQA